MDLIYVNPEGPNGEPDPEYEKISRRFMEDPKEFDKAFARAWVKVMSLDRFDLVQ